MFSNNIYVITDNDMRPKVSAQRGYQCLLHMQYVLYQTPLGITKFYIVYYKI